MHLIFLIDNLNLIRRLGRFPVSSVTAASRELSYILRPVKGVTFIIFTSLRCTIIYSIFFFLSPSYFSRIARLVEVGCMCVCITFLWFVLFMNICDMLVIKFKTKTSTLSFFIFYFELAGLFPLTLTILLFYSLQTPASQITKSCQLQMEIINF